MSTKKPAPQNRATNVAAHKDFADSMTKAGIKHESMPTGLSSIIKGQASSPTTYGNNPNHPGNVGQKINDALKTQTVNPPKPPIGDEE